MKLTHLSIFIILYVVTFTTQARTKNRELIRNIKYLEATEVNKYDWEDPAAKHMVLENIKGLLTQKETEGLKQYLLNA